MSLEELGRRSEGGSSTPYAKKGVFNPPVVLKGTTYRGEPLRYFLAKNGADPQDMRRFLFINRVGHAFDLDAGTKVQIPKPAANYRVRGLYP